MKIATHKWSHADEILAYEMLMRHGDKLFPGISQCEDLLFVQDDQQHDGKKAEEQGIIMLGIGHGRYDEHPEFGKPRQEGECAATLVARDVGIADDPAWKKLLAFVTANDLDGRGTPYDIAYLPKVMYRYEDHNTVVFWNLLAVRAIRSAEEKNARDGKEFDPSSGIAIFDRIFAAWLEKKFGKPMSNEKLVDFVYGSSELIAAEAIERFEADKDPNMVMLLRFFREPAKPENLFDLKGVPALIRNDNPDDDFLPIDWLWQALDAKYDEQKRFLAAVEEFKANAKIREVPGARGKKLKVAVMDNCSNELMGRAARHLGMAILVQRQKSGTTQIYSNNYYFLKLYDLAAMIRVCEQEARGTIKTTDWKELRVEGQVPGAEMWYFQEKGQMLLNNSLTTRQPATKLSLDKIVQLVEIALNPEDFQARQCLNGNCQSRSCPRYKWGLARCARVRRNGAK